MHAMKPDKRRGPVRLALRIVRFVLLALVGLFAWLLLVVLAHEHVGTGASMVAAVVPLLAGAFFAVRALIRFLTRNLPETPAEAPAGQNLACWVG